MIAESFIGKISVMGVYGAIEARPVVKYLLLFHRALRAFACAGSSTNLYQRIVIRLVSRAASLISECIIF